MASPVGDEAKRIEIAETVASDPTGDNAAADYRIEATINRGRVAAGRIEALEDRLASYDANVLREFVRLSTHDPDFLRWLSDHRLLRVLKLFHSIARSTIQAFGLRKQADTSADRTHRLADKAHDYGEGSHEPGRAPRVLVDVTGAHANRVGGGIKRVCDKLALALNLTGRAQPCIIRNGRLLELHRDATTGAELRFVRGDIYAILDSFWDPFDAHKAMMHSARSHGARVALCVHDILPISRPKLVVAVWSAWFTDCYLRLLPSVDLIVSVSRASATEVQSFTAKLGFEKPVAWFPLGADSFGRPNAYDRQARPSFLSIGTLEPKKAYDVALDAFETLWCDGIDVSYTIVGKRGWLCDALVDRITQHPDYGKRLYWVADASDADVEHLLESSYCLIQASLAEGFGLPIAEAAAAGLPIIASDLPVFKEICTENAVFFPTCDSAALARAIRGSLRKRPAPAELSVGSWEQSAHGLVDALRGAFAKAR